jgi:hypothetical protein
MRGPGPGLPADSGALQPRTASRLTAIRARGIVRGDQRHELNHPAES